MRRIINILRSVFLKANKSLKIARIHRGRGVGASFGKDSVLGAYDKTGNEDTQCTDKVR